MISFSVATQNDSVIRGSRKVAPAFFLLSELDRCDREIQAIREKTETPLWIRVLTELDWEKEKALIKQELLRQVGDDQHQVQGEGNDQNTAGAVVALGMGNDRSHIRGVRQGSGMDESSDRSSVLEGLKG